MLAGCCFSSHTFFASSAKLPLFQEKKVEWNGENKWCTIDAPYNTPILYPPFLRGKTFHCFSMIWYVPLLLPLVPCLWIIVLYVAFSDHNISSWVLSLMLLFSHILFYANSHCYVLFKIVLYAVKEEPKEVHVKK